MTIPPKRIWASGLAAIFFAAHLAYLPATLEDIDSLNFALGLHDFDPVNHQPHPPGYPVFMALGKIARAIIPSDAKALAVLGAIFGALAVFPLLKLFESILLLDDGRWTMDDRRWTMPFLATVLVLASPLYWFNALRPLSDIPGLAVTLAAQAALATVYARQRLNPERTPEAIAASGRMIVLGALLSAIAIGMRSQALWLTLPLLVLVLLQRVGRGAAGALLGSLMAFSIGVLAWLVPLVWATGGVGAYRMALTAQGGEDFAGVDMLYRNPSARRLAFSLLETFIYPWASSPLGWIVFALAAIGMIALLMKAPRAALLMVVLIVPYTAFHLLFQETVTTRYALPLVPAIALLAVRGIFAVTRSAIAPALANSLVAVLVVWSLVQALPAARIYASEGSPTFAAIHDLHAALQAEPRAAIGMHQGMARSVRTQNFGATPVLKAPPMREWLELAEYWRAGNTGPVWFLADPARTDTELIDPLSRSIRRHYVWNFPRERYISGVRPDVVDLIRIDSPPGWFATEGWHLTPEILNMSERLGFHEATAYVRRGEGDRLLVIGAESTAGAADISLSIDGRAIDRWTIPALGRIFKRLRLSPEILGSGTGFSTVVVSYLGVDGKPQPVRLTQLAVEKPDAVFFVQHAGWNEIEYSKALQRRWRWTTAKAETFINSGGRDITLSLSGESPLKYFDQPQAMVMRAGDRVLARESLSADFAFKIRIPADALEAADGMVTIETDRTFVPNERSGSPDKRTLGLRIFTFDVQ